MLLAAALGSTPSGCLLFYDYGDYQPSGPDAGEGAAAAGGAGGSAGGGGSASTCGGADADAAKQCRACYESKCAVVLAGPCTASATCGAWYGCSVECCDPSCYRACEGGAVPAGSPIEQMYACICDKCPDVCGPVVEPPGCGG